MKVGSVLSSRVARQIGPSSKNPFEKFFRFVSTARLLAVICLAGMITANCAGTNIHRTIAFVGRGYGDCTSAESSAKDEIKKSALNVSVIARSVDVPGVSTALSIPTSAKVALPQRVPLLSEADVKNVDVVLTMTAPQKDSVIALFPEAKVKTFTLSEYAAGSRFDFDDMIGRPVAGSAQDLAKLAFNMPPMVRSALQKVSSGK